jgi:hypothetical protein
MHQRLQEIEDLRAAIARHVIDWCVSEEYVLAKLGGKVLDDATYVAYRNGYAEGYAEGYSEGKDFWD